MPSLAELQQRFVNAVRTPAGDLPGMIDPAGLTSAVRLEVYRNNTCASLQQRLATVYPVTERLVGIDFFRYAAYTFMRQQPSLSGDLGTYGGAFPDFLAGFKAAAGLLYIADVARMEQARHDAARAADKAPLDVAALSRIAPDDYERLRFVLHSSVRLVISPYPIWQIWEVNQPDYPGEPGVDLDAGGCRVLIWRQDGELRQQCISPGSTQVLEALGREQDLADACGQALTVEPHYDVGTDLQQWVASRVIADFTL